MFGILAPTLGTIQVTAVATYSVSIVSFHFRPPNINVTTGTDVVWTFLTNGTDASDVHTVTADNQTQSGTGVFQSQTIHPGQTFDFTFYSPGRYPYHCSYHPSMIGLVNVTGPSLSPPSSANSSLPIYLGTGVVVVAIAAVVGFMIFKRRARQKDSQKPQIS